jgi:hypothetical protein
MDITFLPAAAWSSERASVLVFAQADDRRIVCVVPHEYLTFPRARQLTEEEALDLFNAQRTKIETRLRQRILAGMFDAHGEIILRT